MATVLAKLKFKSEAELAQIKTAIHTLIAYDLHQDNLLTTRKLVYKEIENRKQNVFCECGCEK